MVAESSPMLSSHKLDSSLHSYIEGLYPQTLVDAQTSDILTRMDNITT